MPPPAIIIPLHPRSSHLLQFFLFFLFLSSSLPSGTLLSSSDHPLSLLATRHCLNQQAARRDCALFTYCCERRCGTGQEGQGGRGGQGHRCMAFLGSIEEAQSACDCTSSSPRPASSSISSSSFQFSPAIPSSHPFPAHHPSSSSSFLPSSSSSSISSSHPPSHPSSPSSFRLPSFISSSSSSSPGFSLLGSPSRYSKWDIFARKADFVGGVILLSVLDLLLLSFTL